MTDHIEYGAVVLHYYSTDPNVFGKAIQW